MPTRSVLVSICGLSGSGKSTLAQEVCAALGQDRCTTISMDSYYKDLSHMAPHLRDAVNYDHPDAIDRDLFGNHLRALSFGETVEIPKYEFLSHTRLPETTVVVPAPVVIVEGIFTLSWRDLNTYWDLAVWLHVEPTLALQRIIERDEAERGWSPRQSRTRFDEVVYPAYKRLHEAASEHAHLLLDGTEEKRLLAPRVLDALCARKRKAL